MDASDWAAWYGATVGSLALFWEIFRHYTRGPRLAITSTVDPDQKMFRFDGILHVTFDAYNRGDSAAKIESIEVVQGPNRFIALRLKQEDRFQLSPVEVAPLGHERFDVYCKLEYNAKAKHDAFAPSTAYVRVSYSRRPLVVQIPAFEPSDPRSRSAPASRRPFPPPA